MGNNFLAITNDELGEPIGETAKCPHCGKWRQVKYGNRILPDGSKVPSKMLGYVKCAKSSYLVSIDQRKVG